MESGPILGRLQNPGGTIGRYWCPSYPFFPFYQLEERVLSWKHKTTSSGSTDLTQLGPSSVERDLWWTTSSARMNRVLLWEKKSTGCWVAPARASPAEKRSHYTLLRTCQATSRKVHSVWVPSIQNRCGKSGKGPGRCHKDDQRTGKSAI